MKNLKFKTSNLQLTIFSRKMCIVISVMMVLMLFQGCGSETTYWQNWEAPNWTDDGKIVFLEDTGEQKIDSWGAQVGGSEEITLYEINNDGSGLREIREIASCEFDAGPVIGPISTSSAADWVVLSIEDWRRGEHYPVMYTIKRNGDSLSEIGSGRNPDFSPDASQIVYQKPNNGIWIMDRDGGNDHQIISDADARYPAWSPDGGRIAYILASNVSLINDSLCISDIYGVMIEAFWLRVDDPDWGPSDSNAVSFKNGYFNDGSEGWHHIGIIHLSGGEIDTLNQFRIGDNPKWSPDGGHFIAYDANGYFVIDREGSNKWYLQP